MRGKGGVRESRIKLGSVNPAVDRETALSFRQLLDREQGQHLPPPHEPTLCTLLRNIFGKPNPRDTNMRSIQTMFVPVRIQQLHLRSSQTRRQWYLPSSHPLLCRLDQRPRWNYRRRRCRCPRRSFCWAEAPIQVYFWERLQRHRRSMDASPLLPLLENIRSIAHEGDRTRYG